MSKLIEIVTIIIVAPIAALVFLLIGVITWLAALGCGLALLMVAFNWIGWHMTRHISSWHAMIQSLEFAAGCGLVVFVVRGLPLLFVGESSPGQHRPPVQEVYYEKPQPSLLRLLLLSWRPR